MPLAMPAPDTSTSTTTAMNPTTITKTKPPSKAELTAFINDPRFNQTFQLPADPSRGRPKPFQVSYADFGFHREDGDQQEPEQVLLFFGPLMSSRLLNVTKDGLAKRYKVR